MLIDSLGSRAHVVASVQQCLSIGLHIQRLERLHFIIPVNDPKQSFCSVHHHTMLLGWTHFILHFFYCGLFTLYICIVTILLILPLNAEKQCFHFKKVIRSNALLISN